MKARGAAAGLALAAILLLPGCLEPYRIHVDATVLARDLPWVRDDCPEPPPGQEPSCNDRTYEVDYRFRQGAGPPYEAILQVFSLRELGRRSSEELVALAHRLVDNGTAVEEIRVDQESSGTRTLRNGLETRWFTQEGDVTSAGTIFRNNVRVRIIAEVGYDGRSQTTLVAVGYAQIGLKQCTPFPLATCAPSSPDFRSWNGMVGDEAGSVGGTVKGTGLVYNLVTHG